jgi:RNA polymerase sigma factor (sigma-70 family)
MSCDTTTLYQNHQPALVQYLTRLTGCRQRAEDLAQTVWLRLLTAQRRGDALPAEFGRLRGYLFACSRHLYIDEYARKHGQCRTYMVDPADFDSLAGDDATAANPEDVTARDSLSAAVREAVDRLPTEQSQVIRMWSSGASIREMAQDTAAPVDTVLSRKKYAFARMRLELAGMAAELC